LRAAGAKLVGTWLRVKPALRTEAAELLQRWRSSLPPGGRLLGVHARGTDKAAHPKFPLERFFAPIDGFLAAHPGSRILLATDDARYHAALQKRYPGAILSRGAGYATRNVVRDPALSRHAKGADAVMDALLLAHSDFLLKGTSALSEFSLWLSPRLAAAHLDLQIEGEAAASPAYTSRVPVWAGGEATPA